MSVLRDHKQMRADRDRVQGAIAGSLDASLRPGYRSKATQRADLTAAIKSTAMLDPKKKPRLSDANLLKVVRRFRAGILGRLGSRGMCLAVCAPLVTYLKRCCGVTGELVHGVASLRLGGGSKPVTCEHYWIALADGRVLDPTADQFNLNDRTLPPVYLGPPTAIHPQPKEKPSCDR